MSCGTRKELPAANRVNTGILFISRHQFHNSSIRYLTRTQRNHPNFLYSDCPPAVKLQETIGAAYSCIRAIDEVEDHPTLDNQAKASILHGISWALQAQLASNDPDNASLLETIFQPYQTSLPEVTLRIGDLARAYPPRYCPACLGRHHCHVRPHGILGGKELADPNRSRPQ